MKIIRYTLFAISLIGGYIIWVSAFYHGFLGHYDQMMQEGILGAPAPDPAQGWTGIAIVDVTLHLFWLLAYPENSFQSPAMSLHYIALLSTAFCIWLLCALEACRTQPTRKALPRLTSVGLSLGGVGFAMAMPMYLATMGFPSTDNQLNSSRGKKDHKNDSRSEMSRKSHFPSGFGFSILGYFLPAALMLLPHPGLVSFKFARLAAYGFYVGWPFCAALLVWATSSIREYHPQGIVSRLDSFLSHPRSLCTIAFVVASIPTVVISFGSLATVLGLFVPQFSGDKYYVGWNLYFPLAPLSMPASPAEATYTFCQWDYIIASPAAFIWGVALYIQACRQEKVAINYKQSVPKILALATLAGLPATTAVLIWERTKILDKASLLESEAKEE